MSYRMRYNGPKRESREGRPFQSLPPETSTKTFCSDGDNPETPEQVPVAHLRGANPARLPSEKLAADGAESSVGFQLLGQRLAVGRAQIGIGRLLLCFGAILLVLVQATAAGLIEFDGLDRPINGIPLLIVTFVGVFLLTCAPGLFFIAAAFLVWRGKRHLTRVRRWQRPQQPDREKQESGRANSHALFLRPFSQDGMVGFVSVRRILRFPMDPVSYRSVNLLLRGFVTYESILAFGFARSGYEFECFGQPEDVQPEIGGTRTYIGYSEWKAKVESAITRSKLTILCIADSEGVLWELKTCLEKLEPWHLVIALPYPDRRIFPTLSKAKKERFLLYCKFREKTARFFCKPLPVEIGDAQFIVFTNGWEPVLFRGPNFGPIFPYIPVKGFSVVRPQEAMNDGQRKCFKVLDWLLPILAVPGWWRQTAEIVIMNSIPAVALLLLLMLLTQASALAPFIYTLF